MKKIVIHTGVLPEGTIKYEGQYIYKVKAYREGRNGLGEGFPQPEFLDLELEGVGGIDGKLEKTKMVGSDHIFDYKIHKYYLLEHEVWVKHLGGMRYVSDWTPAEVWGVACEETYDDDGKVIAERPLGFIIIHSDRRAGYVV